MVRFSAGGVSRRTLLQIAAGLGAVVVTQSLPQKSFAQEASATSLVAAVRSGEKKPGAIADYMAAIPVGGGITDLAGIRAEYRQAIALFPLAMPIGWSFPSESSARNATANSQWERGGGAAEAYMYWQQAVATAAHDLYIRGDAVSAGGLLDLLDAGYNTPVRRAVFEDPNGTFVSSASSAARRGDLTKLKQLGFANASGR